jgi:Flp pilus assembly protein TadD
MAKKSASALVLAALVFLGHCRPPAGPVEIHLGIAAFQNDRWEEAIALWTKALTAEPSSAAAHNNLAVAYEKKGLWDEARKEYAAALKLLPDNPYIKENFRRFSENRDAFRKKAGNGQFPAAGGRR